MKSNLKTRDNFPELLNKLNLKGIGVEVGVQEGCFSEIILSKSKLKRLYSVDPWLEFKSLEYKDIANVSQELQDYRYIKTIMRLNKFGIRSVCLRMFSKEASKLFKEQSLDFVYIDANHSYEGCLEDIKFWWSKVKKGGVLAGHDYLNATNKYGLFRVKKAVNDFARKNNLTVQTTTDDFPKSWYILKK